MMIEKIIHKNKELAIVIRNNYNKEGVNFVTPESCTLQVGMLCHKKGKKIEPHVHKNVIRTVNRVLEVLHLEEGKIDVDFYINGNIVKTCTLEEGDTIILLSGGHGFRVQEDTKMIEVKQGPYLSQAEDKEMIETKEKF
jgi:hypothetical protein